MYNEIDMMKRAQKSGSTPKILAEYRSENVIIMELCKGKTLLDYMKEDKPSAQDMHKIVYKLVKALTKLNQVGVIHNDLKRDNIMIRKKERIFKKHTYSIKIIDFGHAKLKGASPYPNTDAERIKRFKQLDPALANGGPCS